MKIFPSKKSGLCISYERNVYHLFPGPKHVVLVPEHNQCSVGCVHPIRTVRMRDFAIKSPKGSLAAVAADT